MIIHAYDDLIAINRKWHTLADASLRVQGELWNEIETQGVRIAELERELESVKTYPTAVGMLWGWLSLLTCDGCEPTRRDDHRCQGYNIIVRDVQTNLTCACAECDTIYE